MEVFLIFWLMCGGVAAMIASSKGGSGPLGFVVGALFGPFGIIAAFFMGSETAQASKQLHMGEKKKCPRCAELVQPEAKVCRYCGHEFEQEEAAVAVGPIDVPPRTAPTPEEVEARRKEQNLYTWLLFGGIALIVLFVLIFGVSQSSASSRALNEQTTHAMRESQAAEKRLRARLAAAGINPTEVGLPAR